MIANHGDCEGAGPVSPLAPATEFWAAEELRSVTKCPACGAPPVTTRAAIRIDGLTVKECPACMILYVDPIPTEAALARCYGANYYSGANRLATHVGYPCADRYHAGRESSLSGGGPLGFDAISSALELRGKSILEIGCADGALLKSLSRFEPSRLVGIDINQTALDYGRAHYGLDLRNATIESAGFCEGEFDCVAMIDVIEHVPGLAGFFAGAARCVRPGGVMVVFCPNAGGLGAAGRSWSYLSRSLEHVTYPSIASLERLAARHALRIVKAWSEGDPRGWVQYHRPNRARMLRVLCEPSVALSNAWRRIHLSEIQARNGGEELRAILRKESASGPTESVNSID
jgi:2-polyprenyl-3-methyl-5-hydroxy-6-metoxy-1,4-benzoquinol methylase